MGSSSPIFGVKIKNIWNHHLVLVFLHTLAWIHFPEIPTNSMIIHDRGWWKLGDCDCDVTVFQKKTQLMNSTQANSAVQSWWSEKPLRVDSWGSFYFQPKAMYYFPRKSTTANAFAFFETSWLMSSPLKLLDEFASWYFSPQIPQNLEGRVTQHSLSPNNVSTLLRWRHLIPIYAIYDICHMLSSNSLDSFVMLFRAYKDDDNAVHLTVRWNWIL